MVERCLAVRPSVHCGSDVLLAWEWTGNDLWSGMVWLVWFWSSTTGSWKSHISSVLCNADLMKLCERQWFSCLCPGLEEKYDRERRPLNDVMSFIVTRTLSWCCVQVGCAYHLIKLEKEQYEIKRKSTSSWGIVLLMQTLVHLWGKSSTMLFSLVFIFNFHSRHLTFNQQITDATNNCNNGENVCWEKGLLKRNRLRL